MKKLILFLLAAVPLYGEVATDAKIFQHTSASAGVYRIITGSSNLGEAIGFDGSGVLVSLDKTGSGLNVFATSPTFSTSLVTDSTTLALFNTTATTVNAFGAATTINVGASAATVFRLGGHTTAAEQRFLEPSGSGTNYIGFKAAAMAASTTYTLPTSAATAGQVLKAGATPTLLEWGTIAGDVATDAIWLAKGDIAVGTGDNTAVVLTAGANGTILQADDAQVAGLAWVTPGVASFDEDGEYTLTGVWDFTGATVSFGDFSVVNLSLSGSLTLPNGAAPTTDATGEVALDTTVTDHKSLIQYDGGADEMLVIAIPRANLDTTDGDVIKYDAATDAFTMAPDLRTGVRRTIYVNAGAMIGKTTAGAVTGTTESTTNKVMFDTFDFDTTTEEGVGFWLTLPTAWDAGTVTAKFHWTASSSTGTVKWDIAGRCYIDDDAIDQAMGTEQTAGADTLLATGDVHITATTPALTLGGTPTANRPCYFQVTRDTGGDTLGADAKLLGVTIEYTESATEPSAQ